MILLIDIGNTRIKWAQLERGTLGPQSAAVHSKWTVNEFIDAILRPTPRPERVLIGNVGGATIADVALAALTQTWQMDAQFVHSSAAAGGVRNGYVDPQKLGVDRWLAVIGAYSIQHSAACVVSVGTATTIDGVDALGQHLGGVIVPGPDLMVSSLLQNTSEIARRAEQGSTKESLFADNTLGAVTQGAAHALAALVERAVEAMRRQVGEMPAVLLTGGASARIESALKVSYKSVPDLVLRGLAVLAKGAGQPVAPKRG
jgi:type III pantothenate kinase